MNILQTEDLIKGLPDQRLLQEAQSPSGDMPQFLLISEVQRRTDMRKRFANQQDQPEGTIAEQILNEGMMGTMPQQINPQNAQPPPQQPPPNQPFPLPTGQGMFPNPNQFPPPPPPNAEIAPRPQGMAGGGLFNWPKVVRHSCSHILERIMRSAPLAIILNQRLSMLF